MIRAGRIEQVWPLQSWKRDWKGNLTSTAAIAILIVVAAVLVSVPPLTTSVAAVVGIATILLTLVNPLFALGGLILSIPFSSPGQIPLAGLDVTSTELIIGVLIFAWLAKRARRGEAKLILGPLGVPITVFVGLVFLSSTTGLTLVMSLKELLKWFELLAVYLFVINNVTNQRQIKALLVVLMLAAVAEALVGYYQFFGSVGPESFRIGRFLRAYGTFGQPNPFAGYMASVAIPALALGLVPLVARQRIASDRQGKHGLGMPFWLLSFFWGSLGISLIAVIMSMSRGAWFGLVAGVAVVGAVSSRKTLIALISLTILLLLVLLAGSFNVLPAQISTRVSQAVEYFRLFDASKVQPGPENWALVERMANWQAAWGMFQRHPWLGIGVGNFAVAYPEFALELWKQPKGHAHNVYLNTLAEMGIVGLVAYLGLLGSFFFVAGRAVRRTITALSDAHRAAANASPLRSLCLHRTPYQARTIRVEPATTNRLTRGIRLQSNPLREHIQTLTVCAAVAVGMLGALVMISVHNLFDSLFVHGMSAQIGIMLGLITVVDRLGQRAKDFAKEGTGGN